MLWAWRGCAPQCMAHGTAVMAFPQLMAPDLCHISCLMETISTSWRDQCSRGRSCSLLVVPPAVPASFCAIPNKPDNFHSSSSTVTSLFICSTAIPFCSPPSSSFTNALHFQMLIICSTKRLRSGSRLFDLWPVIYFHLPAFKCYFGFTLTY